MSDILLTDANGRPQLRTRTVRVGGVELEVPEDPRCAHQVDLGPLQSGVSADVWPTVLAMGQMLNAAGRIIDGLCREVDSQRAIIESIDAKIAELQGW